MAAGPLGRTGSGRWQKARGQGAGAAAIGRQFGPCSSESLRGGRSSWVVHCAIWHWGVPARQAASSSYAWRFSRVPPAARWVRTNSNAIVMQRCWLASLVSACHAAVALCRPAATCGNLASSERPHEGPCGQWQPQGCQGQPHWVVLGVKVMAAGGCASTSGTAAAPAGGGQLGLPPQQTCVITRPTTPASPAAPIGPGHGRPTPDNTQKASECHASDDRTSPLPAPHSFFCKSSNAKNRKAASMPNP